MTSFSDGWGSFQPTSTDLWMSDLVIGCKTYGMDKILPFLMVPWSLFSAMKGCGPGLDWGLAGFYSPMVCLLRLGHQGCPLRCSGVAWKQHLVLLIYTAVLVVETCKIKLMTKSWSPFQTLNGKLGLSKWDIQLLRIGSRKGGATEMLG